VVVSRRWDRSVPFDHATKELIAAKLRRRVRSLWAAGAPGWRHVARLATAYLIERTREAGLDLPDGELAKRCTLTRGYVVRERRYRSVAVKDKDAKAFFDRQPRIRRDCSGLKPLELVIGDVHPVDIYYRRDDGSLATAKLIGWLDAANNRFLGHTVFLQKGEGVRSGYPELTHCDVTKDNVRGSPENG
jgi:hypothetical protein